MIFSYSRVHWDTHGYSKGHTHRYSRGTHTDTARGTHTDTARDTHTDTVRTKLAPLPSTYSVTEVNNGIAAELV